MKAAALFSLALLAPALAAPTAESKVSKVSLARERHLHRKRADGTVDISWLFGTLKDTVRKYNKNIQVPDRPMTKRDTDANLPLTDQVNGDEDVLYYGTGTVGSKAFTFDFDTGSSDTFVPGPNCGTAQGCVGTAKYDNSGKDQGNTTSITYGSGAVMGENYLDSLTVAGLTATNQNIISLTEAQGFSTSASDGLVGMAFPAIANSKESPFFFTLINEGKVDPKEFSFYLGRQQSGTAQSSELTLGGRDESKYTGSFTPVPVSSQTYWQVALDGAKVGSNSALPTTQGQAAIDTGTTLIIAPTAAAESIFLQIPGAIPIPTGQTTLFAYPCASNPQVSLTFAGKDFAIDPKDLNFGRLTDNLGLNLGDNILSDLLGGLLCVAGIAGADLMPGENFYVVGDTFLKNWYSTYEYQSPSKAFVNFAKSV